MTSKPKLYPFTFRRNDGTTFVVHAVNMFEAMTIAQAQHDQHEADMRRRKVACS